MRRLLWMRVPVSLALALAVTPAAADICLPSLAEEGRRLHEMPAPSVHWGTAPPPARGLLDGRCDARRAPSLLLREQRRAGASGGGGRHRDRTPERALEIGPPAGACVQLRLGHGARGEGRRVTATRVSSTASARSTRSRTWRRSANGPGSRSSSSIGRSPTSRRRIATTRTSRTGSWRTIAGGCARRPSASACR